MNRSASGRAATGRGSVQDEFAQPRHELLFAAVAELGTVELGVGEPVGHQRCAAGVARLDHRETEELVERGRDRDVSACQDRSVLGPSVRLVAVHEAVARATRPRRASPRTSRGNSDPRPRPRSRAPRRRARPTAAKNSSGFLSCSHRCGHTMRQRSPLDTASLVERAGVERRRAAPRTSRRCRRRGPRAGDRGTA